MDFGYEVVRLWERPADELLKAGLGTVPLAQLGQFPAGVSVAEGVSFTISQALDRILREAPADQARRLLTATYLLSGLRIGRQLAKHIFRGALAMRESDTYLAILDEGREEEAKRIIFLVGEDRLGAIDPALRIRINAISDIEQLEVLATRLHKVSSWQELLPG